MTKATFYSSFIKILRYFESLILVEKITYIYNPDRCLKYVCYHFANNKSASYNGATGRHNMLCATPKIAKSTSVLTKL